MTSLPRLSAPQVLKSLPNNIDLKRGRELAQELEWQEEADRLLRAALSSTPTDTPEGDTNGTR